MNPARVSRPPALAGGRSTRTKSVAVAPAGAGTPETARQVGVHEAGRRRQHVAEPAVPESLVEKQARLGLHRVRQRLNTGTLTGSMTAFSMRWMPRSTKIASRRLLCAPAVASRRSTSTASPASVAQRSRARGVEQRASGGSVGEHERELARQLVGPERDAVAPAAGDCAPNSVR